MLADLSECDRIAEKARDGRGLAVIWEIPNQEEQKDGRLHGPLSSYLVAEFARIRPATIPCLPDERHEPVAYFLHILGITRQCLLQDCLLYDDPGDHDDE